MREVLPISVLNGSMLGIKKRYRAGTQPPANGMQLTTGVTVVMIRLVKMSHKNDASAFLKLIFGKSFDFLSGELFAEIKVGFLQVYFHIFNKLGTQWQIAQN